MVRDAYEGEAPDHMSDSSSSLPGPLSEPPSFSGPPFSPDFWNLAIGESTICCFIGQFADRNDLGVDRYLSDAGIDYDTGAEIEDDIEHNSNDSATPHLLELMESDQVEVQDAVNNPEPANFDAMTRPGTLLPPPLAMPKRPSTISKMKDNLNFDASDWFGGGAAAAPLPSVPQSAGPPMLDGVASVDDMLPSDTTRDRSDPALSVEEYLSLSQSQEVASAHKVNSLSEKRGHRALLSASAGTDIGSAGPQEFENRCADYADGFKHASKEGGEDVFLPAFSDPVYNEDFAAFVAAGRSIDQQFREIGQEFESRKAAAAATPSPSHVFGLKAPGLSPASQNEDEFTRAGQIYVAHVLQQNPEPPATPEEINHSYTEEDIEWPRNHLPGDVKVWMTRSCGVIGAEKPTLNRLDKTIEKITLEPELVVNHTARPSSQKPEEEFHKATVDKLNHWAEYDKLMSLSELNMEWFAFEETCPPAQTVPNDLQTLPPALDVIPTLTIASPASTRSFITAEDDEMSMIPTVATPNRFTDASSKSLPDTAHETFSPKASALASSDLPLAPIVTKLSVILLDNTEEHVTGGAPQEFETNSIAESAGDRSQSGRTDEDEAHSNEMDRVIQQYDYGLYGHRSQAYDDGFEIGGDPPAKINVQESASKLDKPTHPKKPDTQRHRQNTKLPVNAPNVPGDDEEAPAGHNSPVDISDDEQEVRESHNSLMNISGDEQAVLEDQDTPKVSHSSSNAAGENEPQIHHGTANIIEAQQEIRASPQTVAESTSARQLIQSPNWPDLDTEESIGKDILQTPKGITFPLEVSAASFSDSAAVSGTPIFTCVECDKTYKKEAYLLRHEANDDCEPKTPKTPKPPRVPIFAGIPTVKLSMTDQELVDNGLPSVQATNWRYFPYCMACNLEFSNVGRLRLHVLQSCHILRENGVYNKPQNQHLAVDDQTLALGLPKSTTAGNFESKQF